jgi:hypothetical protein
LQKIAPSGLLKINEKILMQVLPQRRQKQFILKHTYRMNTLKLRILSFFRINESGLFFILLIVLMLQGAGMPATNNILMLYFNGQELHASGKELLIDLGKVEHRALCGTTIRIKNDSDQVLQIVNVRGSCGLSAPSWPRRIILPGQEGTIQIRYDSSRIGKIDRNLTINANTSTSVTILKVTGEILAK